ncbi:MAG TPA: hypothetical protein PLH55_03645 [Spirochaetales bacterium]|nr:hypothetical protein [Spirochaetales bacterium]
MKRTLATILAAAVLVAAASADLFSPDRPLRTVETEYFTFIYAAESEPAIRYLASFADDAYREIAALLGTSPRTRLPVVMTPDSETLNGYYTAYPYPRIVLYQAPTEAGSSLGAFDDDLRKLFYHELTHAVSLGIRGGVEGAIVAVFGSPLGLSTYLAPRAFVEGVTVSFESRNGFGRATDPLAGAIIRQDIVEGRARSFVQACGAYDRYPSSALHYIYGGYFSRYLQERWGLEKYAELWTRFGAKALFRPLDDGRLVEGRFSRVYGVSLSEAWADFIRSMTPSAPVSMAVEARTGASAVTALCSSADALYYADEAAETVYRLDPSSGESRPLFRAGAEVSRLDASPDGGSLLVSTTRVEGGFPKLAVMEYAAGDRGGPRLLPVDRVRDAAYLPGGGIVGVAVDGYETDLVVIRGADRAVLLEGDERTAFSSPVASADGSLVYAIARRGGVPSVVRITLDRDGTRAASVERLVVPDGLSWLRYLSIDRDGVLRSAWDDESFYRLVEIDGDSLRYQGSPLSGGVHNPVLSAGRVRYVGRFSDGRRVCDYPEDRGPLGFVEVPALWEDAGELLERGSAYDAAMTAAPPVSPGRYRAARYLAPRYWFPTAAVDEGGVESIGLTFVIADPAERLDASVSAAWDAQARAVDLELDAGFSRFAWPVRLVARDSFTGSAAADGRSVVTRSSEAFAGTAGTLRPFSGGSLAWNVSGGVAANALSSPGASPYAAWSAASAALEPTIGWSDVTAPLGDPEARSGYALSLSARLDAGLYPALSSPTAGLEATAEAFAGAGALALSVSGALAVTDGLAYGPDGRAYPGGWTLAASYPSPDEFAGSGSGDWYAFGEASLRLLDAEIQRGVGAFYANRLSIRSGGRAYALAGPDGASPEWGWSAFARASLTWTPAIGAYAALHPVTSLEAWCRPDLADGTGAPPHGLTLLLVASY